MLKTTTTLIALAFCLAFTIPAEAKKSAKPHAPKVVKVPKGK